MVDDGDSNSNWDSNLDRAFDWDPIKEIRIGNLASGWTIPENVNGSQKSNVDADNISGQSPFLIESTSAILSSDEAIWLSEQMMFEADQTGAIDSFFNKLEILGVDLEKLGLLSEKTLPVSIGLAQMDEAGGVAQDIAIALTIAAEEGDTVILSGGYDLTGWGVAINGNIVTHQPHFILAVPLTTLDLYLLELKQ